MIIIQYTYIYPLSYLLNAIKPIVISEFAHEIKQIEPRNTQEDLLISKNLFPKRTPNSYVYSCIKVKRFQLNLIKQSLKSNRQLWTDEQTY